MILTSPLVLLLYCHLVYSLLLEQTHKYIIVKLKTVEQQCASFIFVTNWWLQSIRDYLVECFRIKHYINIRILHNESSPLSINTETRMYYRQKKLKLRYYFRACRLWALSFTPTANIHRKSRHGFTNFVFNHGLQTTLDGKY